MLSAFKLYTLKHINPICDPKLNNLMHFSHNVFFLCVCVCVCGCVCVCVVVVVVVVHAHVDRCMPPYIVAQVVLMM